MTPSMRPRATSGNTISAANPRRRSRARCSASRASATNRVSSTAGSNQGLPSSTAIPPKPRQRSSCSGIAVDDGKPVQAIVFGEQIDRAPIGKSGHNQVRNALQLGFVIERTGQDFARVDEESNLVLTADPAGEVLIVRPILRSPHATLRSEGHLRQEECLFVRPFVVHCVHWRRSSV